MSKYCKLLPSNGYNEKLIKRHGELWKFDCSPMGTLVMIRSLDGEYKKICVYKNEVKEYEKIIEDIIKKSPLGVEPRRIFIEKRISILTNVIDNYIKNGHVPNVKWSEELLDRIYELNEIEFEEEE